MNHGSSANLFHEEDILGKAFDWPLIRRLLKFARPYTAIVGACVLLILLGTLVNLAMPKIYQNAINEHIVTTYKSINLQKLDSETRRRLEDEAGDKLLVAAGSRRLVSGPDFRSLDPGLSAALGRQEAIGKPYFVVKLADFPPEKRPEVQAIVSSKPDVFKQGNGFYYYLYEDVSEKKKLAKDELGALRSENISGLKLLVLIFIGLLVVNFFLTMGQMHLSQYAGQRIIMDVRMKLFAHIQRLSLKFFDSNPVGRLVTRVTNDIQVLNEAFTNVMINLFRDIFILVGILIMLFLLNWELALVTLCVVPFIIWITFIFRKRVRGAYREVRAKIARINANIAENISGMSVVQLFHREDPVYEHFKKINHENYLANLKQIFIFAVFRPAINVFSSLAIGLVIWFGGGQVIQGRLSLGELWAFITYLQMFFRPIQELSQKYNILQAAMASSERIFLLLDETDQIPDPEKPKPLADLNGEIEFKNVWFSYDKEFVLEDISFKVKPGEKIALVGPTGSGKTSIISLLSRFYDVDKGRVLVDGLDVRDLSKYDLRSRIAVVMQEVFLFSGDVKSNIRLNSTDITDEAVRAAAAYVKADNFIERLPRKYDHEVQESGATFSQGERQLLSFARAVAFDPGIIVLDEATASIDTETEILIQEAIQKLMEGRTSIVIAHRLSTVRNVDRIIVLHAGRIVEEGSHQELLARRGLYYKLYQLQYNGQTANN